MRAAALLGAWLLAGAAHAELISSVTPLAHFSYTNFNLAVTSPLRHRIEVGGVTQYDATAVVGDTVVVSLTSGTVFDQLVALYTNGVPDELTHLFNTSYRFDASLDGAPPVELGASFGVIQESIDMPDLAGWVIDEFRVTSTVTCWDPVNVPTKDTCSAPIGQSRVEMNADLKAEFFGHLANGGAVPEPASGALVAASLVALGATRRRRAR